MYDTINRPLGQLHVGQPGPGVVLLAGAGPGELLADHQLGDVHTIAQQVRDGLLGIGQSLLGGSGMGVWEYGGMDTQRE